MSPKYDYVIAGGGSSACVAAWRLTVEKGARVLVLERGPSRYDWLMRLPAGYMKYLERDKFLEMHQSTPQSQLNGRAPIVPQSKVLGGGSAVNAMVYMRGQQDDYNGWDQFLGGNSGWSYADMLPAFRTMENNARLNNEYHGIGGPLNVTDAGFVSPATEAFILAAQQCGIPHNSDFNGACQAGVGLMQFTIGRNRNGRLERCDAATAFLTSAHQTGLLTVETGATVAKILMDKGRAVGVQYVSNGTEHVVRPECEVLVAAGTYNTAKLLLLSGLGPADELRDHGIPVIADLPGVGGNLQDHHEVPVINTTHKRAMSYHGEDRGLRMLRNGLQFLAFGSGPVATIGVESCCFYDPDGGTRPTIQLYCVPTIYMDRDVEGFAERAGVTLNSCLLRPKARGSVKLRSADPVDKPVVDLNFLGTPEDIRLSIASMRFAREIFASAPIASMMVSELLPGSAVQSDADLLEFCKRQVKTNYHPVGTARMGREGDSEAVLDTKMCVRGVTGLRVIDCASIPFIPSANTNAVALALGWRAYDMIMSSS
jgi:choline dehydrogenase